jgi:putative IMPACT (imprinted ancient) family translation regulator
MVKEEIDRSTNRYKEGITTHPNQLVEAYKTHVKRGLRRKAYPIQPVTVYVLHIAI